MGDDDDAHIKIHRQILDDKKSSDDQKILALRHIEKHNVQKKGKIALQQAQAKMQALQAMSQEGNQQGGSPQDPGQGGPQRPQPPGIGEGNLAQSMSSPAAIMSGVKGVDSQ